MDEQEVLINLLFVYSTSGKKQFYMHPYNSTNHSLHIKDDSRLCEQQRFGNRKKLTSKNLICGLQIYKLNNKIPNYNSVEN